MRILLWGLYRRKSVLSYYRKRSKRLGRLFTENGMKQFEMSRCLRKNCEK